MLNLPSFLKQLGENFHTDLTTIHNQIIPINTLDYPFQNGVILNDSTVIASKLKNTVQQLHAGFPIKTDSQRVYALQRLAVETKLLIGITR